PGSAEGELRYRLLALRYLDGLTPPEVQQALAISRSTYQREHAGALAALTSVLAERWQIRVPGATRSSDPSPARHPRAAVDPGRPGVALAGGPPSQLTSFIGRESDVQEVSRLLGSSRLVTLTGPPGIGKTRLAAAVATVLREGFADGVWFISLASIRDPGLVAPSIARVRGLREHPGRSVLEALADDLRDRRLLLVLDNFEQLLNAAPIVANLLATAPGLHALVTSRAPLHVRGETVFPVPPLTLPALAAEGQTISAVAFQDVSSVRLFVERARAANADFALTDENVADVNEICRRIDGLPLAIELAAARSRVLSPRAIRVRLEQRLLLLTSGQRDLPERQQALRTAIDWSYDLLDEDARRFFRHVGIFAGGCDLEAASAICSEPGDRDVDLLSQITALVDQSLLMRESQSGAEPRFHMLESIREYALDRLAESQEGDLLWGRFVAYYRQLGRQATASLWTPDQTASLQRLDVEHDNLRAVLRWLLDREDAEAALELAGSLAGYWLNRSFWAEGRRWLQQALASGGVAERSLPRARALLGAGILAVAQGDFTTAGDPLLASSAIFRENGDRRGLASSLGALANVSLRNRARTARALIVESLALFRELGDRSQTAQMLLQLGTTLTYERDHAGARQAFLESFGISRDIGDDPSVAEATRRLGDLALVQGDHASARARFQESLAEYRELSQRHGIAKQGMAVVFNCLGELARREGDLGEAARFNDAALQLARDLGDTDLTASTLHDLGRVRRNQGDFDGALACFRESLVLRQGQGHTWGIATTLSEIAESALGLREPNRAVRYYAAARRLHRVGGLLAPTGDPGGYDPVDADRQLAAAKARLGDDAFAGEWAVGDATPLAEIVRDALRPSTADPR
ncbi:MAG: ATP-binding protein, partial [Chloroflexota bacterium]